MQSKKKSAGKHKLFELKTHCELFGWLYIACLTRDGNLDQFFCHENQPYPPSLSQGGYLYSGTKYDLLECFTPLYSTHNISDVVVNCSVLDGSVIVQMLCPHCSCTFDDYKCKIFVPYLMSILAVVQCIDVVFGIHFYQASLKSQTREKCGIGECT